MRTTFALQLAASALYLFESAMLPFLNLPISFLGLTLIYSCSVIEIFGVSRLAGYAARHLRRSGG